MSDLFEALASPARRAILDSLQANDGQTLFELCSRLTMEHGLGVSRQAISQRLDILESVGLLTTERRGRCKFHFIDTRPLRGILERWPVRAGRSREMKIGVTSVFVDDQDKALRFYTEVLGFVKKAEIPLGEHRWLTETSAAEPDGTQLSLEPDSHPAVGPFKRALAEDGIPCISFTVEDVRKDYERLCPAGVRFSQEPAEMGPVVTAVLDDTCGNLIQIVSPK